MPSPEPRPAGLARRLGCVLYDALILLALGLAASLPFGGMDATRPGAERTLYQLYLLAVGLGYFVALWRLRGCTVGMQAWGVRLVGRAGARAGCGRLALRAVVALASWACLGLGFWWSLARADGQCWHDLASGTRLVRSR